MPKKKSLLDDMPVQMDAAATKFFCGDFLAVVGHCPRCSNPIYGNHTIKEGDEPTVKRTCDCCKSVNNTPEKQIKFEDTISTK